MGWRMSMSTLRLLIVHYNLGSGQVYRTMPRVTGFGRGGSKHKKLELNNREQLQHRTASVTDTSAPDRFSKCLSGTPCNYRHARKPGYRGHPGFYGAER